MVGLLLCPCGGGLVGSKHMQMAWPAALVHLFTALGAVCALFATRAVLAGAWEQVFAWLGLALLIDGIDGTFARMANVSAKLPRFSGDRLDLIVDYVTYVFVPSLALLQAGYLSGGFGVMLASLILLSSLFHFSDTESKSDDHCFIGFPAIWNIVAFYVFAFQIPTWATSLLVLAGVSVAVDVLDVATGPSIPLWYLTPGVSLISLIVLSYLSMRVSPIFTSEVHRKQEESVPDVVLPQAEAEEVPLDASPGRLPDAELEKQKERLTGIVEAKSLYLNPDLRLSDLADAMGVRPYRVSQILNQGLHTSFYDLINQYRIEKAQELLTSPAADRLNLLGVAMESGFRSKSVFNEVFKKTTGKTPSQYRDGKTSESSDSVNRIARSGR